MKSRPRRPKPRPHPKAAARKYPAGFVPPSPAEEAIPPSQRSKVRHPPREPYRPAPQTQAAGSRAPARPNRAQAPEPQSLHVASLDVLAEAAVNTAHAVEKAVFGDRRRADRAIAWEL